MKKIFVSILMLFVAGTINLINAQQTEAIDSLIHKVEWLVKDNNRVQEEYNSLMKDYIRLLKEGQTMQKDLISVNKQLIFFMDYYVKTAKSASCYAEIVNYDVSPLDSLCKPEDSFDKPIDQLIWDFLQKVEHHFSYKQNIEGSNWEGYRSIFPVIKLFYQLPNDSLLIAYIIKDKIDNKETDVFIYKTSWENIYFFKQPNIIGISIDPFLRAKIIKKRGKTIIDSENFHISLENEIITKKILFAMIALS